MAQPGACEYGRHIHNGGSHFRDTLLLSLEGVNEKLWGTFADVQGEMQEEAPQHLTPDARWPAERP